MSFLRSLSAGVSGLRNHQTMMDVVGNNIANINSIGFKSGRVTFGELFSQTLYGGSQPGDSLGGLNPRQVGLGMGARTIDTIFSQGNIEMTSVSTDLAVQGNGFFIVNKNGQNYYTRDGGFRLDAKGRFVNPSNGAILQGRLANAGGDIDPGTKLENIIIPLDARAKAKATDSVKFSGNLNSASATGDTATGTITIYDSLGNKHSLSLTFTKTDTANEWTWSADVGSPAVISAGGSGTITFNSDGSLNAFTFNGGASNLQFDPSNGASQMTVGMNIGTPGLFSGLTQTQGTSNIIPTEQNGYESGKLNNISIDHNGKIVGFFSNGTLQTLGEILLAEFINPAGLLHSGENLFELGHNSGIPQINIPGNLSNSTIVAGGLEQSNVDLAEEFTKMITAQRGFQANARVISTSDEFLHEVVNIKR